MYEKIIAGRDERMLARHNKMEAEWERHRAYVCGRVATGSGSWMSARRLRKMRTGEGCVFWGCSTAPFATSDTQSGCKRQQVRDVDFRGKTEKNAHG